MLQHLFQPWIRTAAISCINTWGENCGFKEFFDGEMIGDALKSGSPTLRIELWAWLTERLPTCKYRKINVLFGGVQNFLLQHRSTFWSFYIQLCLFAQMVYMLPVGYTTL
jgi:hypothetical protein